MFVVDETRDYHKGMSYLLDLKALFSEKESSVLWHNAYKGTFGADL